MRGDWPIDLVRATKLKAKKIEDIVIIIMRIPGPELG